jgi:hypothetical protein
MFHYHRRRWRHRHRHNGLMFLVIVMFALRAAVVVLKYVRRDLEELAHSMPRTSHSTEIQARHVPF